MVVVVVEMVVMVMMVIVVGGNVADSGDVVVDKGMVVVFCSLW